MSGLIDLTSVERLTLISNKSLANQDLRAIKKKYYGLKTLKILFASLFVSKLDLHRRALAFLAIPCNTAADYYCTSIQCTESCDFQKVKCIRDVNY